MRCEWNPKYDFEADEIAAGNCTNEAAVIVGVTTAKFHLCWACAARPYFRMFKKRAPLDPARPQPTVIEQESTVHEYTI